ncbi:MAG: hypothetical protein EB055_00770 [Micrococcales bacterium]|nr:hypothetical protein [Micrococcales bacterium]
MSESIMLTKFASLLRSGLSIPKALNLIGEIPQSSEVGYLIRVAAISGTAVARELELIAQLVAGRERASRRIKIAQASPKASAQLVIFLPLVTIVLAQFLGMDIIGTILAKPALLVSLSLGILLLAGARFISNRLISKASPKANNLGCYLLGVAIASSAGLSINQAQNLAAEIYQECFRCLPSEMELKAMAEVSALVSRTGSSVGDALRKQAENLQSEMTTKSEIAIEKLQIKLLLPLGLAVLPAFVLIAVVPLMVSMVGSR